MSLTLLGAKINLFLVLIPANSIFKEAIVYKVAQDHFKKQDRKSSLNHIQPFLPRCSKTIPVGVAEASAEMIAADGTATQVVFPGSVR